MIGWFVMITQRHLKMTLAALVLALAIAPLSTAQLVAADEVYVEGAASIIDYAPDKCAGTYYAPHYMLDGATEKMYIMGGSLSLPMLYPLTSEHRFADEIYMTSRSVGNPYWGDVVQVLDKTNFHWYADGPWLEAHPEDYIGAVASPSVIYRDGRYHMAFTATINDPNICAGEHPERATYGPCRTPWSYFVMMWATSPDGVHWTVEDNPFNRSGVASHALRASALWYTPSPEEERLDNGAGGFKGVTGVSMEQHGDYWYFLFSFWSSYGPKNGVARIQYSKSAPGLTGTPEIFNSWTREWVAMPDGKIPTWFNEDQFYGSPFAWYASRVTKARDASGVFFVATITEGFGHLVTYRITRDFETWTPARDVLARNTVHLSPSSYMLSVIDPGLWLTPQGWQIFYASTQTNAGTHRCGNQDTTTIIGAFRGMGIYQASPSIQFRSRPVRPDRLQTD